MGTDNSTQRAIAGNDAYVAGRDIQTINIYQNDGEDFRPPFLTIDSAFLGEERKKPKEPYIARPPLWADVVHGQNADSRFLEREQFGALLSSIEQQLLEPLRKGSDRRLRTLFVTGAPGCGKSTLVRHAVATIVEREDVIVADLGVNHGRLIADDVEAYLKGLTRLTASGKPVLLLMDDPFFANSGWDLLLETLARPNYSGIAVLGASPTYLYETYGRPLSGHQIVLSSFVLGATTNNERLSLAEMYGVRSDPAIGRAIDRHEDLLVFAMETASGSSFTEIIERIWSTLNDGRTVGPMSAMADIQWPVMAFLLTSYLHRHYVMCPESLLRAYLVDFARNTWKDFIDELTNLTISEGWHIFRVLPQDSGSSPAAMIGTMHARVAERAWQVRPFKAIDQVGLLARASAQAPQCAPQLAEFILACRSSKDPADRTLALKVAEQWRDDRISTAELSALVRGLRATPAALPFRGALRERLKRRDSQSWLAITGLIPLERRESKERTRLSQMELPYALKLADLSADSSAALNLVNHGGSLRRQEFAATLHASLNGDLAWGLDSKLLIWLLHNHDAEMVHSSLPRIFDWLDANPEDERARAALVEWYTANLATIESGEIDELLDRIREWLSLLRDSQHVISAFFGLAAASLRVTGPLEASLIEEMSSWLEFRPDDSTLRERYLRLLGQNYSQAAEMANDAIIETLSWLAINPDASNIRRALLGLMLAEPAHPRAAQAIVGTLAWLGAHPADNRVRDAWSLLLEAAPDDTLAEAMTDMLAWLGEHQDESEARTAVIILARTISGRLDGADIVERVRAWLDAHPDDGRVRVGFLALLREVPPSLDLTEIITGVRSWILSHPDDSMVRGSLLALALVRPGLLDVGYVMDQMIAWLAGRPDDEDGHLLLLRLARKAPGRPEAAEALTETLSWLDGQRGGNETWVALFGLVRAMPRYPRAPEVCMAARQWLAEHPDDTHIRIGLLSFIRTVPNFPQAEEVIAETSDWLDQHGSHKYVKAALRGLQRARNGVTTPRQPGDPGKVRAALPSTQSARTLCRPGTAEELAEIRQWLGEHPDDAHTRHSLLMLIRTMPEHPDIPEIITQARQWLGEHVDDTHVRIGLLGFIQAVPDFPQAEGIIAETSDWLDQHGAPNGVKAAMLSRQRARKPSPSASPKDIAEARAQLAERPNDRNLRVCLLSVLHQLPGHPAADEIIAETRQWLDEHPDDAHTRHSLLMLMRALPEHPDIPEIIAQARQWIDEHPDASHVCHGLVALIGTLPDFPHTAEAVASTLRWLDEQPSEAVIRRSLLALILGHVDHPHASEAIVQTLDWLADNPQDGSTAKSLLTLIHLLATDTRASAVTIRALGWLVEQSVDMMGSAGKPARRQDATRELPDPGELSQAHARVAEQPDDADARARLLTLIRELPGHPDATEVVAQTRQWLGAQPLKIDVRAAMFHLSLLLPDDPEATEVIPETFSWLMGDPYNSRFLMKHFFAALGYGHTHPKIPEVIKAARRWLAESPAAYPFRSSLLKLARKTPENPVAAELVSETRLWLLGHQDDTSSRASLLGLVRMLPHYPEAAEVVHETRSWLAGNPEETLVREGLLALARKVPDDPETIEVAKEARDWLAASNQREVKVRCALLGLMRALPGHPETIELARDARDWLVENPEALNVREVLLSLVRTLPKGLPLVDELLSETREWIVHHSHHPHRFNILLRILDLAVLRPDGPIAEEMIAEARAWLADHRGQPMYENMLASLVGLVRERPGTQVNAEVIAEARAWLTEHAGLPGGSPSRALIEDTLAAE